MRTLPPSHSIRLISRRSLLTFLALLLIPVSALAAPADSWSPTLTRQDCITPTSTAGPADQHGPLVPEYWFPDGVTRCHEYEIDTVERPMVQTPLSNKANDYYPDLDITYAYIGEDATWLYLAIDLVGFIHSDGVPESGKDLQEPYGFEIDYDPDNDSGRADLLIKLPDASPGEGANTWTTKDLEIWQDGNDDVGSINPALADGPNNGNGFETEAWKDGGPLVAYWRKSTSGTARIEFAVLKAWITSRMETGSFVLTEGYYRGWTMKGINGNGNWYFHDQYTDGSYGSPYPIDYQFQTTPPTLCLTYEEGYPCKTNPLFPAGNVYEQDNSGGIGSFTSGEDPQLTLIKSLTNDDGGNAVVSDFDLVLTGADGTHNGGVSYNDPDGGGVQPVVVSSVEYSVSETPITGYSLEGIECLDDDTGGTIDETGFTLIDGQNVTCTISNDDIAPTLTLYKQVNGGDATVNDFGLRVAGTLVGHGETLEYAANTALSISEDGFAGYTFDSITGDIKCPAGLGGTVTLDEGEDVSCTIVNNVIPAALNLSKVVASGPDWDPVNNQFTVVYTITATNGSEGAGTYDLYDEISPGPGLSVAYAELTSYNAGSENDQNGTIEIDDGNGFPYPFTTPDTLVSGEGLAGLADESWTVTVIFDIDLTAVDDDTFACDTAGEGSPGQGFFNRVTGIVDEADLTDNDACTSPVIVNSGELNLVKQVTDITPLDEDTYEVLYTVGATNSGALPGLYDLVDTLDPGTGITVDSVELTNYVAGTENSQTGTVVLAGTDFPYSFNSGDTLVTNEALAAGASEAWQITATFTVDYANQELELECLEDGHFIAGNGFYNYIEGALNEDTDDNHACGEPGEPDFAVTKTAGEPVKNDDSSYSVTYTIMVENAGDGDGVYSLDDTLLTHESLTLTAIDQGLTYDDANSSDPTAPPQDGTIEAVTVNDLLAGTTTLLTDETLAGGESETWTIVLRFELDTALWTPAGGNCVFESGETGTGFTNRIEVMVGDTAADEDDGCSEISIEELTRFRVEKTFSDGNPADVEVFIRCRAGLPLEQSKVINKDEHVTFTVKSFTTGELDCDIWEEPGTAGYTTTYAASGHSSSAADVDGCHFTGVEFSDENLCEVINTLDPVTFTVNKEWFFTRETAAVQPLAEAEYTCFNVLDASDGTPGEVSGTMAFSGMEDSEVVSGLYPLHGGGSYCTAVETWAPPEAEVDDSDCENVPLSVAGTDAGCTIHNTVFFEGIPTLSQYGMAILALLMLGMGAVGIRRFA